MKKIVFVLLIIGVVISSIGFTGCSKFSKMKREEAGRHKKFEKDKKKQKDEEQLAYNSAVQRNYDMQSPETQKAMRDNAKKSEKYMNQINHKKEFFLVRWWHAIFKPSKKKTPSKRNL